MYIIFRFNLNDPLWLELDIFVKFDQSDSNCDESLNVEIGDDRDKFCSENDQIYLENHSAKYKIPQNSSKILQFTYSNSVAKEGGKFVLQAQGK